MILVMLAGSTLRSGSWAASRLPVFCSISTKDDTSSAGGAGNRAIGLGGLGAGVGRRQDICQQENGRKSTLHT